MKRPSRWTDLDEWQANPRLGLRRAWRRALVAQAPWFERAIVFAYAAATGGLVVLFTLLAEAASHYHQALGVATPLGPWIHLVWTPALTAALAWLTMRFAPGTAGSGIPQVLCALESEASRDRTRWVSVRLALSKIALVSGGLLAGLSTGREGPTVQIGAGVMGHARRWLRSRSEVDEHDLMVAGAAAGIAAAFNTPLGGIVFALEKLTRRRSIAHSSVVIAAIVISGLVSIAAFGNDSYFGVLRIQELGWKHVGPGLMVTLVAGVAGGLFSRLLINSTTAGGERFNQWRHRHPVRFAAAIGLAVGVIGLVAGGTTAGAGYAPTRALLEADAELPAGYTGLKFVATWLSSWSGVPGGIFAPSLAIGAGIGADVARLSDVVGVEVVPLIALGMVSFLSAATQGPITAFIIVMEMISGHVMVLSLMASSMLASGISRAMSRPLYSSIAAHMMLTAAPTLPEGGLLREPPHGPDAAAPPAGATGEEPTGR